MMDETQLPAELEELERRLSSYPRLAPTAELRARVLDGVRLKLRCRRKRARWSFVAIAVGAVLLWMNLSLSATRATDYRLLPRDPPAAVDALAAEIRQLTPEVSLREARRQAVLLRAGLNLARCPRPTPPPEWHRPIDGSDHFLFLP